MCKNGMQPKITKAIIPAIAFSYLPITKEMLGLFAGYSGICLTAGGFSGLFGADCTTISSKKNRRPVLGRLFFLLCNSVNPFAVFVGGFYQLL